MHQTICNGLLTQSDTCVQNYSTFKNGHKMLLRSGSLRLCIVKEVISATGFVLSCDFLYSLSHIIMRMMKLTPGLTKHSSGYKVTS